MSSYLTRFSALAPLHLLTCFVLGLALPATAQDAPRATLELVAEGFTHPLVLTEAPDATGRLFVADQTGQIWILTETGERRNEPFLDLSDRLVELDHHYDERGLLGLAFHPDYARNGRFFVFYSAPLRAQALDNFDHTNVVSEFHVSSGDADRADPDSEKKLLQIDHPYTNHNAGMLAFGPADGYLYIALGDGGHRDDQDQHLVTGHVPDWYDANDGGNGQDIENNLLGSILRIDVDASASGHHGGEMPYTVPEDNPFTDIPGVLGEHWAYGFRNPYRFAFDPEGDHALIVGDAGQNMYEEISVVEKGNNYGWNVHEGTHCFSASSPTEPRDNCPTETSAAHPIENKPLVGPVVEMKNTTFFEDGQGLVIVGGHVNRGTALPPQYNGAYFFGMWSRQERHTESGEEHLPGRIFAARMEPGVEATWPWASLYLSNRPNGEFDALLLGFGQNAAGDVYVLAADEVGPTGDTGRVYRLTAE